MGDGADVDLVAAPDHMNEDEELGAMSPTGCSGAAQTSKAVAAVRLVCPARKAPVGLDAGTLLKCLSIMLPMVKAADNS